jgi:hypothetical protein
MAPHMTRLHLLRAGSSLCLLVLSLGSTRCAAEPDVKCTVTGGAASARLVLVGDKTGTCNGVTFPFSDTGDVIGIEAYSPIVTDPNINDEVTSLAFQSGALGALRDNADGQGLNDPDAAHTAYALGKFDHVFPDSNGTCTASGFTAAELVLPVVPAHQDDEGNDVPEQSATHIKYEWSNVRTIVTVNSIGTQTFADLTYTQDGCVAHYQVSLLTPNVSCTSEADDTQIDASLCNAESDPSTGFAGSGIGQGISVSCDPDLQMCLPNRMTP